MEAADLAERVRRNASDVRAKNLFEAAFRLELEAARLADPGMEPTRSVLFRSAASLALDCGLYGDAAQLVREARLGSPPPEIADDLAQIDEEIQRYLRTGQVREAS
ncbi:conserved hypothetical protein [Candidatus Sulfopaludibacter sp. SbA4]|nr:conserved hypothetical protein [Candidatus Sulfopaludibacter sp. SbA4]